MSDPDTIRVYDTRAADYAEMTDDHNATDPKLVAFIAACPPGGQVLDLGCGPGASAAVMAQQGLVVEAMDASAQMVALADAHPGVEARQSTFDEISGQGVYDGIWASFSLLHAPRVDFPRHLAACHLALKPGGMFVIGMKLGSSTARDGIGRQYTYYSSDALDQHLVEAGFTVVDHEFGTGEGLDGSSSDYVSVTAHA
ncbi:MAG: SAM-dependent methyltransferase [Paracoccaceae bacterium]|jgi:SAM-dependent methyltransferase